MTESDRQHYLGLTPDDAATWLINFVEHDIFHSAMLSGDCEQIRTRLRFYWRVAQFQFQESLLKTAAQHSTHTPAPCPETPNAT